MLQIERLQILSAALRKDAVDPKGTSFSLSTWLKFDERKGPAIECGTEACAVGLACLTPELQAQGLRYIRVSYAHDDQQGPYAVPAFGTARDWEAVEEFFGLTDEEAFHLFNQDAYPDWHYGEKGELAVADRIDALIAERA